MAKQQFEITSLGALGDGVSEQNIFVPMALPTEIVEADVENGRARNVEWIKKSVSRIEPVCKHFGDCGGCRVQHMGADLYADWKVELIADALSKAGIEVELEPMVVCAPRTRRRAVFSAVVKTDGVDVGFQRAGSNHVVDIDECHLLSENLESSRTIIGKLAQCFLPRGKTAGFTVLESRTGFDISVSTDVRIDDNARRAVNSFAVSANLARVAINDETIVENKRPLLDLSGFSVTPPPGGFVQAVKSTEQAMVKLVCDHLAKCKRVADIFSGSGTFALPLARNSSVVAAESDGAALVALDRAWREATGKGLKPIKTEKRDLHNRPFMSKELDLMKTQGVVFDPPRAGAEMQSQQLAKSKVKRIAAVSCNPTTLARDLRILIDGGYTLQSVTPLDQFLWSPHVEAVALLVRGKG
jgi:23S rRNA (uracil1939-C5)-methyltransferase